MSSIIFKRKTEAGITLLQNQFIDKYMINANGEFVKIYIYILRCLENPLFSTNFTIAEFADVFACTENDILRALKYWENAGLISLESEGGMLKSIVINDFKTPESAATLIPSDRFSSVTTPAKESASSESISSDRLSSLASNSDVKEILCIAQNYIGKTLNTTDTNILLFMYDNLEFSTELIDFLVEYCVSNGHRELRYMEKVAIAWHEAGISTVSGAKDYTAAFSNTNFAIMKAFGLSNRTPVPVELENIDRWTHVYGFSLDVILEACNKTMSTIHHPSFPYTDSILLKWKQKGVKSIPDIRRLDELHEKQKIVNATNLASVNSTANAPGTNQQKKTGFNNFPQRENVDMSEIEKSLLNRK